ncbi:MAG: DUF2865 domain-containing protein [Xanthobacteraceae bacterium]
MRRWPSKEHASWRGTIAASALVALAGMTAPAHAGFFDFLFGNSQDQAPPPQSYAEPPPPALGRVAPAPLGSESVRQGGASIGHAVAFCVRLCDGESFPLEHMANATPVETCRAMCPASKTKIFYGSEVGSAVAKDGARYAALDTAFTYRQQIVPNCTCNGRNARGLVPLDLSSDPTLRPGDIVSTKQGFMAFTGKTGTADAFTPVDPASIETELNSVTVGIAADDHDKAREKAHDKQARADEDANIVASRQPGDAFDLGTAMRGQIVR